MVDLQAQPIEGGFRLFTTDTYHIDLLRMLFNWRVAETPIDAPLGYDRYWCFQGRGHDTILIAVAAAFVWGGDPESEPVGWIKAWDGRRTAKED